MRKKGGGGACKKQLYRPWLLNVAWEEKEEVEEEQETKKGEGTTFRSGGNPTIDKTGTKYKKGPRINKRQQRPQSMQQQQHDTV